MYKFYKEQYNFFKNAIESNSLAHAYLVSGKRGLGKKEFVLSIVGNLLNVDIKNSHDLYVYENALTIKEARQLKKNIGLSPLNSKYKVVVINNAQNLKTEAANAILKLLEEPSGDTIFFLLTTNSGLMLPTIVSRCHEIRFFHISDEIIRKRFNTKDIEDLNWFWTGRVAYARKLIEDKTYKTYLEKYVSDIEEFMSGDMSTRFKIIENYTKHNKDDISPVPDTLFVELFMGYLRKNSINENFATLRNLFNLYKGLTTTNLNSQFALRALAVSLVKS